jgi:hypothetical protein
MIYLKNWIILTKSKGHAKRYISRRRLMRELRILMFVISMVIVINALYAVTYI